MAKKYTGADLETKREIDRINRQIRQAFQKLGKESRLAGQYETILYGGTKKKSETIADVRIYVKGKSESAVRYTKEGIPQIRVTQGTIYDFQNVKPLQRQLKQLGQQQTVASAQKAMIKAYEKRTGQKIKGRSATAAAISEEVERYQTSEAAFRGTLQKLYAIEKERGVRLKAIDDIKAISKGHWTSDKEFESMVRIADEALRADGGEPSTDEFAKNQW